ncbi:MAG: EthD family reductase [Dehalococcoidia bacterium]
MTVKLIYCINRKPELSVAEFQEYWFNTHGPIAARIPGVRRYVQCHTLPETYGEANPLFDGAAQLSWDSLEDMQAVSGRPEVTAALEDERAFIDHSRVAYFVTEEHVEIEGRPGAGAVKMIACFKRKPGISKEEFAQYWGETHAPIARGIPGLVKYVRAVSVAGVGGREPDYDGAAELYYPDLASLRTAMGGGEAQASSADVPNFVDTGAIAAFITRERPVIE